MIEIPGYTIKREINVGELSSVYLAQQTSLEREVALKVIAPAMATDAIYADRFLQVARALASFSHPHIVAVYDVGVGPGQTQYFSMQYLAGGDFAARTLTGMSEQDLTETLAGVARALGYVHQRGLIHRAIAPKNVMYDGNDTPFLIDFGIAPSASQDAQVTSAGFAIGTSHYMSPEQARGGELDARSDIYSLGALCYYGLVGRPPYDGADGFAVAYAHVFEPIPRLPPARAHWQPLIDGALAKDPKDRYASVEEFLDALTSVTLDQELGSVKAMDVASDIVAPSTLSPKIDEVLPQIEEVKRKIEEVPIPSIPTVAPTSPALKPVQNAFVQTAPAKSSASISSSQSPRGASSQSSTAPPPSAPSGAIPVMAAEEASARSNRMRAWPLLAVVLGLALIAFALFNQYGKQHSALTSSTESASTPPATAAVVAPAPQAAAVTPDTTTSANSAAATAVVPASVNAAATPEPASSTASTTATQPADPSLGILDAAENEAVGDNLDPSKFPTVVDPVVEAVRLGRIDLAGQRLTTPPGTNALDRFQFALKLDPKNKAAKVGIVEIAKKYIDLADKGRTDKMQDADLVAYGQLLDRANEIAKTLPEGADVQKDIVARRHKAAEPLIVQAKVAAGEWEKVAAKAAYEKALQIDPENTAAKDGLKLVASIGEAGFVFHDKLGNGGQGPELEILPGDRVAMQRRPVTRAEFRRFWNEIGHAMFAGKEPSCRDRESIFRSSKKRGWENPDIAQEDNHPVVCIDWHEAAAFAQWLGKQTGKHYRLPNSAEFDQVATRAVRGDCKTANLADAAFDRKYASHDGGECDDEFADTSPVGHFEPVAGIYDIDGNVREWVANCGNGAAADVGSTCRDFRVKGRGWLSVASKESATFTDTYAADVGLNSVGFRVVRDVEK